MAKNYQQIADNVLNQIGGESNVLSLAHCMTRLRFKLKDESKVDLDGLKKVPGVLQVIVASGQYQVVIGTDVGDVYDAILSSTSIEAASDTQQEKGNDESPAQNNKKKGFLGAAIDLISGVFTPFLGAFTAVGLLKGFLILFTSVGILDETGTTYTLLYALSDGMFNFIPLFLAYTAGKKFGANPFVTMAVAAALVYPGVTDLFNASLYEGAKVTLFGIPVSLINYPGSVIPIIVAAYGQSKLEKLLKKFIPNVVQGIFLPLISLLVTGILTFLVIGPVTNLISTGLADGVNFILGICPPVAGFIFGLLYPLMIIFGFHWGLGPIAMNNLTVYGSDPVMPMSWATNFAIAGCSFGVFLKTKNVELKQVAGSAGISALIGGITEPAIYGLLLKYKRPYVIVCILDAIGGMIIATAGVAQPAWLTVSALTLPVLLACGAAAVAASVLIGFFGGLVGTLTIGFNDSMIEK